MNEIQVGQMMELTEKVTNDKSALAIGSGDLQVFSTPSMIALMEKASLRCIASNLDSEATSVGGLVHIKHLKPTSIGVMVRCQSQVTAVELPKVEFEVKVFEGDKLVGTGTHTRFVVDRDDFLRNL